MRIATVLVLLLVHSVTVHSLRPHYKPPAYVFATISVITMGVALLRISRKSQVNIACCLLGMFAVSIFPICLAAITPMAPTRFYFAWGWASPVFLFFILGFLGGAFATSPDSPISSRVRRALDGIRRRRFHALAVFTAAQAMFLLGIARTLFPHQVSWLMERIPFPGGGAVYRTMKPIFFDILPFLGLIFGLPTAIVVIPLRAKQSNERG